MKRRPFVRLTPPSSACSPAFGPATRNAAALEAGSVRINDVMYTHGAPETPWFGIKQSGFGITHSKHGLREFVRMKHVNWDLLPMKTNLWWFPYSAERRRVLKLLMKV